MYESRRIYSDFGVIRHHLIYNKILLSVSGQNDKFWETKSLDQFNEISAICVIL